MQIMPVFKNSLEWYNISMITQESLNILLLIGFLVTVACIVFVTYYLVKALKSIINLTESLAETSDNIKQKLQMRFLAAIPALIVALAGKLIKRGR